MPDNSTPKHHHNKMGTEPIGKLLLSMSLPAMFSMLIQALYNIVDSIYVAQIGEHALTAVSLAFPVQNLMIAVSVGTGVGLNSLISRRLGERREKEASAAATHGVLISFAESLLFLLFGLFFCRMFFSAFTSDSTVIQMGVEYTSIVTIFSFGCFIEINLEKTLQATGNMFYPMVFQLIGAISNIILDPIFIFGWFRDCHRYRSDSGDAVCCLCHGAQGARGTHHLQRLSPFRRHRTRHLPGRLSFHHHAVDWLCHDYGAQQHPHRLFAGSSRRSRCLL